MEKREIDWEKVGNLFVVGANVVQAAASIGVSRETLYRRCQEDLNMTLSTYQQEKWEKGNSILLGAQYEKAIKEKNPTMLIWLGKQRLNQKENLEEKINKEIEKKFDEQMDQILVLLGSDRKIDESKISNETKS